MQCFCFFTVILVLTVKIVLYYRCLSFVCLFLAVYEVAVIDNNVAGQWVNGVRMLRA